MTKESVDELKGPLLSFFSPVSVQTIGSKPLVLMKSFKGCLVHDEIPFPGGTLIKQNKSALTSNAESIRFILESAKEVLNLDYSFLSSSF